MGVSQTIETMESDALRMVRESAEKFTQNCTDHRRTRALRGDGPGYDADLAKQMAALGWFGIVVPEEHEGLGLGLPALCAVLEETARGLLSEPLLRSALVARLVSQCTNAEAQRTTLPGIAAGEAIPSLAWQETLGEDALLQWDDCRTKADSIDGRLRLTGRKLLVDWPGDNDLIVVACGAEGVGLYAVERNAPGLEVDLQRRADGMPVANLTLQGVAVREVLATGDAAHSALDRVFDEAAVMACAELCGVMDFLLGTTLEFLRTRVQFEKPIGSFQALQHRAVDLHIQRELALSAYADALAALEDGSIAPGQRRSTVSRAKSRCGSAGVRIALDAIQLHGAIGFTDEHDVGLYVKRALVLAALYGGIGAHQQRCERAFFA